MINIGDVIHVTVTGYAPYGIFVQYNDYIGLIHISEISKRFVKDVSKYAKLDEIICVKVLDVDDVSKKIECSLKKMYDGDDKYAGNYLESGRGFATKKKKLPVWIRETNEYYKKKFK